MKSQYLLVVIAVGLLVGQACTPEIAREVDCQEECGEDCLFDDEFDYEDYPASCDDDGAVTEFCGPSTADDCVSPDFEIAETTVADIQEALRAGEISCEWLVYEHQQRALWHDLWMGDGAPPLNAFVYLNDQALETARRLDAYQQCEGELSGPLHCAPFVAKSNYASKEVPLTNGSLALLETEPTFDAFSVARLRGAGAVLVGSTTMDEFASGAQGISGRSGKTGNSYDRNLLSGGSSAGSSVAVSANMAIAGLGTDNCSSLTIPASYNGLFTMRSSHQLLSTQGIFPSNRLDAVPGPMTRTVEDLALFLDGMAQFDPNDGPHCTNDDIERADSYGEFLDVDGLEGKRIGVLRRIEEDSETYRLPYSDASSAVNDHYEAFFEELESLGAEVIDDVEILDLPLNRRGSGSGYDANEFLAKMEGGVTSYDELCETGLFSKYVFSDKEACFSRGDQSARQLENNVESGLAHYASNRDHVEAVLDEYELDALLYPADRRGVPAPMYTGTNCILASITGLPTSVVPSGEVDDLPIGMSFTAHMFDEQTLLEIAYAYEQSTFYRRPPQMPELEGPPPVDIATFNDIHYDLGLAAYEEVLRDGESQDLTAQAFEMIAEDVLADWELDAYLE